MKTMKNKLPLSQRPIKDRIRYHVSSARGWLRAGAPHAASCALKAAIVLVSDRLLKQTLTEAYKACGTMNPRSADSVVDQALRMIEN